MECDTKVYTLFSELHSLTMNETKFNIYGENFYPNGFSRMNILSYIAPTREEALVTCKRLNPGFHIMSIWVDESEVEVVKVQSLR